MELVANAPDYPRLIARHKPDQLHASAGSSSFAVELRLFSHHRLSSTELGRIPGIVAIFLKSGIYSRPRKSSLDAKPNNQEANRAPGGEFTHPLVSRIE